MAINLLSPNLQANAAAKAGGSSYTPNNIAGFGGMNIAPKISTPMGVTATTPMTKTPAPPTVLPKAQQNPIVSNTTPTTSTNPVTPPVPPAQPSVPQTQYNAQGQSIGTQHPGMAGFNPQTPTNTQTNPGKTLAQANQGTPQTTPTTFSGLLGAAVNQQNSPYNQTAQAGVGGLLNSAQTNPGASGQSYQNYQNDQAKYAADQLAYNNTYNGLLGQQGVDLAYATGSAGQYQLQNSGRLQAEQQAVTNDLAGVNANISGTQTQQTGFNEAAGNALTGQGQVQGALQGAAGLIPSGLRYGNSSLNPQQNAQSLAQQVMGGQLTYQQALDSLGYAPDVASTFLNQAITQSGGSPLTLQAQGTAQQSVIGAPYAAQASNIQTSGTSAANSWNGIYNTANTQAATYSQQQSAINSVGNQALTLMQQAGINPSSSQFANLKINQLGTQFSSPQYAAFNTAIQSLQARIGSALQAGEIPTAATSNASSIANGNLTLGALASTLSQVDQEMTSFVKTQSDLANYAKGQLSSAAGGSQGGSQSDPLNLGI